MTGHSPASLDHLVGAGEQSRRHAAQAQPSSMGLDVVSFFNRAGSQGGSLSELAKAPGTGPDNH
jgi:hypothetical protein